MILDIDIDYCSSAVDSYRNLDSMSFLWLYYQMQLSRCIFYYDIVANFNIFIGYISYKLMFIFYIFGYLHAI